MDDRSSNIVEGEAVLERARVCIYFIDGIEWLLFCAYVARRVGRRNK